MTYGCSLIPYKEIRELTWGDFSEGLKQIEHRSFKLNLRQKKPLNLSGFYV